MFQQAFLITIWGMGGVFAFLSILILCMNLLKQLIQKSSKLSHEKMAVAIAIAHQQKG